MDCCLCGGSIDVQHFPNGNVWFHGQNAQPIKEGRCCTWCWEDKVVHQRIISFDIGQVVGYWGGVNKDETRVIKGDELECKRQLLMSEGEECCDEEVD